MRASNTHFQFKQFLIEQADAAMKVTTDACLFGAWSAQLLPPGRCLDIGAGTGLLMLMLAQKGFVVDGIELDETGFEELKKNIAGSPWSDKLKLYSGDVRAYSFPVTYDAVIINPPFYENDMRSPSLRKNGAMHDASLTLKACLEAISRNLRTTGIFTILLPYHRNADFETMAMAAGFNLARRCHVRQTQLHEYFRTMLYFTRAPTVRQDEEIVIRNSGESYSQAFIRLLKDYYLYL